ncbi:hypothetical protein [Streptomyces pseudovenezuelae]|uniref:hypothetical protein n=1 Tax=Streptomyces pseudovenezuelae TaxID=67350 RepID=UPI003715F6B4
MAAPLTEQGFIDAVRYESQIWGGAVVPLVPVAPDGRVEEPYIRILPGAAIDGLHGIHPHNLTYLPETQVDTSEQKPYGYQLAFMLLEAGKADEHAPIQVVELEPTDPWRMIYAACLGLLPDKPDADILDRSNLIPELTFETIIEVERVRVGGSIDDLLRRLNAQGVWSPRKLSMVHLAYGNSGSANIRSERTVLPDTKFARYDAGPNIIVVCSANDVRDAALLWNLRGACGDFRAMPIGLPVDEVTPDLVRRILREPRISRNGFPVNSAYLTSASLSKDELASLIEGGVERLGIASCEEILDLGHPGSIFRNEVLVWDSGKTRFVPLSADVQRDLFTNRPLAPVMQMHADVTVYDSPFPSGPDIRFDAFGGSFHANRCSISCSPGKRTEVRDLAWPSTLLMAKTVAAGRGFELQESEPGRAARVLLAGLGSIAALGNLTHAPLLSMLEEMAARQGFGWYKDRLRRAGQEADPLQSVGPTTDELPEKTFNEFKRAFRNSDRAAKYWLLWAEEANLILKGFQLLCPACDAKQWVPVAGFTPPIICRGCAREMKTPFGDRTNVEFRYRISERLRRVYEQDAMGHLLLARYFHLLFSSGKQSKLIGLHPGMEARRNDLSSPAGEADVLLLTRDAEFIPAEVKRTSSGFSDREIEKLDYLVNFLQAPWSVVATCQYGKDAGPEFSTLRKNTAYGYTRVALSYDQLLEHYPFWSLGGDPFEWSPMNSEGIAEREKKFVNRLARSTNGGEKDWLTEELLRQRKKVD